MGIILNVVVDGKIVDGCFVLEKRCGLFGICNSELVCNFKLDLFEVWYESSVDWYFFFVICLLLIV